MADRLPMVGWYDPGQLARIGGAVAAPVILGLYLLVSLNLLRRHGNEAFSSLRIQDWKSFLRLHIDEDGVLTIHPIGIRRVPRRWRAAGDPGGLDTSELLPDDPRWTPPALIEPTISVTRGEVSAEARRRPAAGAPE